MRHSWIRHTKTWRQRALLRRRSFQPSGPPRALRCILGARHVPEQPDQPAAALGSSPSSKSIQAPAFLSRCMASGGYRACQLELAAWVRTLTVAASGGYRACRALRGGRRGGGSVRGPAPPDAAACPMHARTRAHKHTHTHTHAHKHARAHTDACTCTCTQPHTCTRTRRHAMSRACQKAFCTPLSKKVDGYGCRQAGVPGRLAGVDKCACQRRARKRTSMRAASMQARTRAQVVHLSGSADRQAPAKHVLTPLPLREQAWRVMHMDEDQI